MAASPRGVVRDTIISITEDHEPGMYGYMPAAVVKISRQRGRSRKVTPLLGDAYSVYETVVEEIEVRAFGETEVAAWKAKLAAQNAPPPCPHCGQPWDQKKK